jgi:hypothetical protein
VGRLRSDRPNDPTSTCRRCHRPAPPLDSPAALYWELVVDEGGRRRHMRGMPDAPRAAGDPGREGARPPALEARAAVVVALAAALCDRVLELDDGASTGAPDRDCLRSKRRLGPACVALHRAGRRPRPSGVGSRRATRMGPAAGHSARGGAPDARRADVLNAEATGPDIAASRGGSSERGVGGHGSGAEPNGENARGQHACECTCRSGANHLIVPRGATRTPGRRRRRQVGNGRRPRRLPGL